MSNHKNTEQAGERTQNTIDDLNDWASEIAMEVQNELGLNPDPLEDYDECTAIFQAVCNIDLGDEEGWKKDDPNNIKRLMRAKAHLAATRLGVQSGD